MVQWAPRTNQEIKIRKIGLIFPWRINHLEIRLHKKHVKILFALISFLCRVPSWFSSKAYMIEGGAVVYTYVLVARRVRNLALGTCWIRQKPSNVMVEAERQKVFPWQNSTPFSKIRLWNVAINNVIHDPIRRPDLTVVSFAFGQL